MSPTKPNASKIAKFTPSVCKDVSDRVVAALAVLADELGVTLKQSGGSYGANHYTLKLEFALVGENGIAKTRAAEDFERAAILYGLAATDLGRTFRSGGRTFTITGLRPRAGRRQIIAMADGGKEFCFSAEDVKRALSFESNPERAHASREK